MPIKETIKTIIEVDDLAQEIRRVDGDHSLGAAALAEALLPFLQSAGLRIKTKPFECWVVVDANGDTFIKDDGPDAAIRMDVKYPRDAPHRAFRMREVAV